MTKLKYNSAQIRNAANTIRTEVENIKNNINKMNEVINSIQTGWKDNSSSKKYIEKVEEKKIAVTRLNDELGKLADTLENCAKNLDANTQNIMSDGGAL